jgi:hypothetical protein
MTPEAKVKAKVVRILKSIPNLYYFFPATGGYGRSGVPDIIICYKGRFYAIECKTRGNKTTALQDRELSAISAAGGLTMIVNEDNVDLVRLSLTGEE